MWLCERFGWSLEYVDGLGLTDAHQIIDIVQSRDNAFAHEQRRATMQAQAAKKRR